VQGGKGALRWHHSSLAEMLREVYPDYPWRPSRFASISEQTRARRRKIGSMRGIENQRLVLSHIGRQLAVNEVRVSFNDLHRFNVTLVIRLVSDIKTASNRSRRQGAISLLLFSSRVASNSLSSVPLGGREVCKLSLTLLSIRRSTTSPDKYRSEAGHQRGLCLNYLCLNLSKPYSSFYLSKGLRLVWG